MLYVNQHFDAACRLLWEKENNNLMLTSGYSMCDPEDQLYAISSMKVQCGRWVQDKGVFL